MDNKSDKQVVENLNPRNKHLIKGQNKLQKANKIFKATEIKKCYDGTLRWVCKCDLKVHPIALILICKIFVLASFISGLLFFIIYKNFLQSFLVFIIMSVISCGVSVLIYYFVYAKLKKNYCNFYEMDSKTIRQYISKRNTDFEQIENLINKIGKTEEKFNVFSKLHRFSKHRIFCKFSDIKKIIVYERDLMLEIRTKDLKKLQVYASVKDIKFVYNHIISRCNKNLKIFYK